MLGVILASFAVGMALRRILGPREMLVALLDRYVIMVALPCLVLSKMSRASLGTDTVVPVAIAWGAGAVAVLCISGVARVRAWPPRVTGAALLVGVLGNTSFLGLAIVRALLGETHVVAAISFDQLGSFLGLATFGSVVASWYGGDALGWRPIARRLVRFAPFMALVASPLFALAGPPRWMYTVLDVPGGTVGAVAMFSLGWRFSLGRWQGHTEALAVGLAVKMALMPAIVVGVALLCGVVDSTPWQAAALQTAAPPMVTAGIMAIRAGFDDELVTAMVGVGTLVSGVSLPLWWLVIS